MRAASRHSDQHAERHERKPERKVAQPRFLDQVVRRAEAGQQRIEITAGQQPEQDREREDDRKLPVCVRRGALVQLEDQPERQRAADIDGHVVVDEDVAEAEARKSDPGTMVHRRIVQGHIEIGCGEGDGVGDENRLEALCDRNVPRACGQVSGREQEQRHRRPQGGIDGLRQCGIQRLMQ